MCASFWVSALLVHGFGAKSVLTPSYPKVNSRQVESVSAKPVIPPGLVRYQADAPIKFVGLDINHPAHEFGLVAKNVSGRPITGYALAHNCNNSTVLSSISTFVSSTDFPTSLDVNATYTWTFNSDNVKEVWVDFVEFSDGTIWGDNTTKTLESMNAWRIGTRQAAQTYNWVLRSRGPQAMLESIPEPVTNTMIDRYDQRWRSSFNSGVEMVCAKLMQDKANVEITMNSRSGEAYNAALTERFNRTLSSYINFRR